jgi:hypothetical protein
VCQGEASARYAVRNQGSEFFQSFEAPTGLVLFVLQPGRSLHERLPLGVRRAAQAPAAPRLVSGGETVDVSSHDVGHQTAGIAVVDP